MVKSNEQNMEESIHAEDIKDIKDIKDMPAHIDDVKNDTVERYKVLNKYIKKDQILFVGSSLMEQFPIYEFIQDYGIKEIIYNRGIGGYTTQDMLKVLDTVVFDLEPSKIFINIGTNDMNSPEYTKERLIERYETILTKIRKRLPEAKIYVMAYYPVNGVYDFGNPYMKEVLKIRTNARIHEANEAIERMAAGLGLNYINVNRNLFDAEGNLKQEYTIEGMHMYASGYRAILDDLMEYVRD